MVVSHRLAGPPMRFLWNLIKLGFLVAAAGGIAFVTFLLTIQYVTTTRAVQVPDVVGLSQATASRRMDAAGLRIQFEEDEKNTFDDRIPPGHILRQDPPAGSKLKQDRKVRVVVSLGPRNTYIPRVVGETLGPAQMKIQQAGLKVGDVVYVASPLATENTVMDQEAARTTGADGQVNLLVSSGLSAPVYVMPDLIGKPALRARAFLELRNFRVSVEREPYDGVPEGTVVRQKPFAGHPVRVGDSLRLGVSVPGLGRGR